VFQAVDRNWKDHLTKKYNRLMSAESPDTATFADEIPARKKCRRSGRLAKKRTGAETEAKPEVEKSSKRMLKMEVVGLVLSQWLSVTPLVNIKYAIVAACCDDKSVSLKSGINTEARIGVDKNLIRVEAAGSGAVIVPEFSFNDQTVFRDLEKVVRQQLEKDNEAYVGAWITFLQGSSFVATSLTEPQFPSKLLMQCYKLGHGRHVLSAVVRTRSAVCASGKVVVVMVCVNSIVLLFRPNTMNCCFDNTLFIFVLVFVLFFAFLMRSVHN